MPSSPVRKSDVFFPKRQVWHLRSSVSLVRLNIMSSLTLLDLPTEIRLKIYGYLFSERRIIVHKHPTLHDACMSARRFGLTCNIPYLLLTSKAISSEALPVFISCSEFTIGTCPCWSIEHEHVPISPALLRAVEDIQRLTLKGTHPHTTLSSLGKALAPAPLSLQILSIDFRLEDLNPLRMLQFTSLVPLDTKQLELSIWRVSPVHLGTMTIETTISIRDGKKVVRSRLPVVNPNEATIGARDLIARVMLDQIREICGKLDVIMVI